MGLERKTITEKNKIYEWENDKSENKYQAKN